MRLIILILGLCAASLSFAQLTNVKKGYWDIKVSYPTWKNRSTTAGPANAAARRFEKQAYNQFLAQAKKDLPELKKMNSAAEYQLLIQPTVTMDTALFCSGYVTRYDFTGGAHGNTTYQAMNYTMGGKSLKLQDLFESGVNGRDVCSAALVKKLKADKTGSMVEDGSWTKLDNDQAKRFVVTKTGILFLFNSYDLGAYAEGAIKCEIPYTMLTGLNKKLLGGLLPKASVDKELVGVKWIFDSMKLSGETFYAEIGGRYDLTFQSDGRVGGHCGANTIGGTVSAVDGSLRFGPMITTLIANPENSIADKYLSALNDVRSYRVDGTKLSLYLPGGKGEINYEKST